MEQFFFIGYCAFVGTLSGFLGGLLGIGGGVVIVPALVVLLDHLGLFPASTVTPIAVATSLACVVFTSLSAALAQLRAGNVDWTVARRWTLPLVLGSYGAGWIATALPLLVFRGLIGGFLTFVAFVMLTSWRPAPHRQLPGPVGSALVGGAGGLIAGFAGIGGGNVIVPALIYFNTPLHRAAATSSALGVPVAVAGCLGYLTVSAGIDLGPGMLGYVYLPGFAAIVGVAILMAPLGVAAAQRIEPLPLRRVFGFVLLLLAAHMLYGVWFG